MRTTFSSRALAALFILFQPLFALAQQTAAQPSWGWGPWHMSHGWGFGWIFPLLMLLMMVVCVAGMFRGHGAGGHCAPWRRNSHASRPVDSALQILDERFARGEIQQQEYEAKKAVIASRADASAAQYMSR